MSGNLHVRNLDDEIIVRLKRRAGPQRSFGRSRASGDPEGSARLGVRAVFRRACCRAACRNGRSQAHTLGDPAARRSRRAVKTIVVDASVVIKWVFEEDGSQEALALRKNHRLVAPDLLVAECANILWKKVRRGELSDKEADLAAKLLERSDVDLFPMRGLVRSTIETAVRLSHPAYDCIYLTLAADNNWTYVTADESFVRKVRQRPDKTFASVVLTMNEAGLD